MLEKEFLEQISTIILYGVLGLLCRKVKIKNTILDKQFSYNVHQIPMK